VVTEQGHYAQAQALLDESRDISQAQGDQARVAWATLHQARLLFLSQSEPQQAQRLAEQSLAQFEAPGIGWMRAWALSLLGHMHLARGEWAQARAKLEESAVYLQEIGNRCDSCEPLLGLARAALGQQELAEVRRRQGLDPDPFAAFEASGYAERVAQERTALTTAGGYPGA